MNFPLNWEKSITKLLFLLATFFSQKNLKRLSRELEITDLFVRLSNCSVWRQLTVELAGLCPSAYFELKSGTFVPIWGLSFLEFVFETVITCVVVSLCKRSISNGRFKTFCLVLLVFHFLELSKIFLHHILTNICKSSLSSDHWLGSHGCVVRRGIFSDNWYILRWTGRGPINFSLWLPSQMLRRDLSRKKRLWIYGV